jgi:hypothetical protein
LSALSIFRVGIGNVKRAVELAVFVAAVENIGPFWSLVIALSIFLADRLAA